MSLEEVMADFRRNGRDVDLDLSPENASTPAAKRLMYGLVQKQRRFVEREIAFTRPYQAFSKSTIALYSVSNDFTGWKLNSAPNRWRPSSNYRKYMLEYSIGHGHTWDTCSREETSVSKTQGLAVLPVSVPVRNDYGIGSPARGVEAANLCGLQGNFQANPISMNVRRTAGGEASRPTPVKSAVRSDSNFNRKPSFQTKMVKRPSGVLIFNPTETRDGKTSDEKNARFGGEFSKITHDQMSWNGQFSKRTVSFTSAAAAAAAAAAAEAPAPAMANRKQQGPGCSPTDLPAGTNGKPKTKAAAGGRALGNLLPNMRAGEKTQSPSETLLAALMPVADKTKTKSYAAVVCPTTDGVEEQAQHKQMFDRSARSGFKKVDAPIKKHLPLHDSSDAASQKDGGARDVPGKSKEAQRSKPRRSRESSQSDNRPMECVFCKTNGETPALYRTHLLKDEFGRTTCNVLRKYVCPLCHATGENAHTVKYCPKNSNPPAVATMTTLKSMRSSTGTIRPLTNGRKAHPPIVREPTKLLRRSYS